MPYKSPEGFGKAPAMDGLSQVWRYDEAAGLH